MGPSIPVATVADEGQAPLAAFAASDQADDDDERDLRGAVGMNFVECVGVNRACVISKIAVP